MMSLNKISEKLVKKSFHHTLSLQSLLLPQTAGEMEKSVKWSQRQVYDRVVSAEESTTQPVVLQLNVPSSQ